MKIKKITLAMQEKPPSFDQIMGLVLYRLYIQYGHVPRVVQEWPHPDFGESYVQLVVTDPPTLEIRDLYDFYMPEGTGYAIV